MNEHQWTIENLAWYVNGTLVGSEPQRIEQHLNGCLVCQQEWRAQQRILAAVSAPAVLPSPDQALAALSDQLDSAERRWWRRLPQLIAATPTPMRVALAVQSLALVALIAVLANRQPAPTVASDYRTLSSAAPVTGDLRIMFAKGADAGEIEEFVDGLHGRVVSGPSSRGVYTLDLPDELTDGELDAIRRLPVVSFAERPINEAGQ